MRTLAALQLPGKRQKSKGKRQRWAFAFCLLPLAFPIAGQERANRIGVFITNPALDNSGGDNGGFGIAYERRFTERWTAEVSVSREEFTDSGLFGGPDFEVRATPVDLTVRYDFRTPSHRWRPFLGGGARWVSPSDTPRTDFDERISGQVVGGIDFNFAPRWSARADVKALLQQYDEYYDSSFKLSLGAGLRF